MAASRVASLSDPADALVAEAPPVFLSDPPPSVFAVNRGVNPNTAEAAVGFAPSSGPSAPPPTPRPHVSPSVFPSNTVEAAIVGFALSSGPSAPPPTPRPPVLKEGLPGAAPGGNTAGGLHREGDIAGGAHRKNDTAGVNTGGGPALPKPFAGAAPCAGEMFLPGRDVPTPGQRGHSPQRHTAAGTATLTATDTGNTVPQRADPIQTASADAAGITSPTATDMGDTVPQRADPIQPVYPDEGGKMQSTDSQVREHEMLQGKCSAVSSRGGGGVPVETRLSSVCGGEVAVKKRCVGLGGSLAGDGGGAAFVTATYGPAAVNAATSFATAAVAVTAVAAPAADAATATAATAPVNAADAATAAVSAVTACATDAATAVATLAPAAVVIAATAFAARVNSDATTGAVGGGGGGGGEAVAGGQVVPPTRNSPPLQLSAIGVRGSVFAQINSSFHGDKKNGGSSPRRPSPLGATRSPLPHRALSPMRHSPHYQVWLYTCSADGSTHPESNKLYRKVKHRARPTRFYTHSHELPALIALAQHITHSHSGSNE